MTKNTRIFMGKPRSIIRRDNGTSTMKYVQFLNPSKGTVL
jgi:hypothetical protein